MTLQTRYYFVTAKQQVPVWDDSRIHDLQGIGVKAVKSTDLAKRLGYFNEKS